MTLPCLPIVIKLPVHVVHNVAPVDPLVDEICVTLLETISMHLYISNKHLFEVLRRFMNAAILSFLYVVGVCYIVVCLVEVCMFVVKFLRRMGTRPYHGWMRCLKSFLCMHNTAREFSSI